MYRPDAKPGPGPCMIGSPLTKIKPAIDVSNHTVLDTGTNRQANSNTEAKVICHVPVTEQTIVK